MEFETVIGGKLENTTVPFSFYVCRGRIYT